MTSFFRIFAFSSVLLMAGACTENDYLNEEPMQSGEQADSLITVNYTVRLSDACFSRADGQLGNVAGSYVSNLRYAIYEKDYDGRQPVIICGSNDAPQAIHIKSNREFQLTLRLKTGKEYYAFFWADASDPEYNNVGNWSLDDPFLTSIKNNNGPFEIDYLNGKVRSNNFIGEKGDAFYCWEKFTVGTPRNFYLYRPLNCYTVTCMKHSGSRSADILLGHYYVFNSEPTNEIEYLNSYSHGAMSYASYPFSWFDKTYYLILASNGTLYGPSVTSAVGPKMDPVLNFKTGKVTIDSTPAHDDYASELLMCDSYEYFYQEMSRDINLTIPDAFFYPYEFENSIYNQVYYKYMFVPDDDDMGFPNSDNVTSVPLFAWFDEGQLKEFKPIMDVSGKSFFGKNKLVQIRLTIN